MKVSRKDFRKVVELDESPDLSWLGEYKSRPSGDYYIDRETGDFLGKVVTEIKEFPTEADGDFELFDGIKVQTINSLDTLSWLREAFEDKDGYYKSCEFDDEDNPTMAKIYWSHPEVLASYLHTMERNEYRYFESTNYPVPGSDSNWKDALKGRQEPSAEEWKRFKKQGIVPDFEKYSLEFWMDVLYTCEDYDRMEDYNRGEWQMNGVRAKVELRIPDKYNKNTFILQTIQSPGIWGIESDSGDYEDEVFKDECGILEDMLKEMGIEVVE